MYYDTVHCSYDLGPGFWNHNLHTKELSQTCGCYWISPAGELFEVDYTCLLYTSPSPRDS